MRRLFATALLFIPVLAIASDAPDIEKPVSPLAVAAIKKHDDAISVARKVYLKSQAAAEQQLVGDLDKALTFAMHSKNPTEANLKEANRISAAKAEAAKRLQADAGDSAAAWVAGTSWNYQYRRTPRNPKQPQPDIKYRADGADGTVETSAASGISWATADENTIIETMPGPGNLSMKTTITFSSDRKFAFRVAYDPYRPDVPDFALAIRAD